MGTTATDIIKTAQSFVGFASGAAANKFNVYYNEHVGAIGNYAWAWCSAFQFYISATNGGDYPATANCTVAVNAFKQRGTWLGKIADPKPGDIIFFNWFDGGAPEDHVGIVEYVDSCVHTIEGNTGGGNGVCARRTYAKDYACIHGYGRPGYTSPAPSVKNIIQWLLNGGKNQLWKLGEPDGGGWCTITDLAGGRALDVKGGSKAAGTEVIAYKPNGRDNQLWKLVSTHDTAQHGSTLYTICSKLDNNLVLDISGASVKVGAKAILWPNKDGLNQRFAVVPTNTKGIYHIVAAHSLLPLDVSGG